MVMWSVRLNLNSNSSPAVQKSFKPSSKDTQVLVTDSKFKNKFNYNWFLEIPTRLFRIPHCFDLKTISQGYVHQLFTISYFELFFDSPETSPLTLITAHYSPSYYINIASCCTCFIILPMEDFPVKRDFTNFEIFPYSLIVSDYFVVNKLH